LSLFSPYIKQVNVIWATCPIKDTQPWHISNNTIYHSNTIISIKRLKVN